jgi:hypothetical protein
VWPTKSYINLTVKSARKSVFNGLLSADLLSMTHLRLIGIKKWRTELAFPDGSGLAYISHDWIPTGDAHKIDIWEKRMIREIGSCTCVMEEEAIRKGIFW